MPNTVLVGAQWGDEGKGKVIDILSSRADIVVRYQGGNNAGHTVVIGDDKFILHLIPSGILHKKKVCVIGCGVVLDPKALLDEISMLAAKGISVEGRLFISLQTHVIFPYHRKLDELKEGMKKKIGTTKRGIGPCYADKVARSGIRVADLINRKVLAEKLEANLEEKNAILSKIYGEKAYAFGDMFSEYCAYADKIRHFAIDTGVLLNNAIDKGRSVLFEGAQGTLLDVDHGTYPFVTSSSATAGGATIGSGVGPTKIDKVIGVVKAYTTRVGEGPFPTEFDEELLVKIRDKGGEFGATTGRPRRCGWFDSVIVKHAVRVNGISEIAVTKLDVLDELENIKICTGYEYRGKTIRDYPYDIDVLVGAKPIYEEHPGWRSPTSSIASYARLPARAKRYLMRIQKLVGAKIVLVSVGSDRRQTLSVK